MDLEIVTVGTELLLGFTTDTNAAAIARAVSAAGGRVVRTASVADNAAEIRSAATDALGRTGFVVITGGLGPTSDDGTKEAVAALFGMPLELDATYLRSLEDRFAKYRRGPLPPSNRSQAEIPRGATVLANRRGTAPGLVLDNALGTAVLLPGVPLEMRLMVEEHLIPMIRERVRSADAEVLVTRSLMLRTTGVTESGLASLLHETEQKLDGVSLAYLPGYSGVDLRLTVWRVPEGDADAQLEHAAELLLPALGHVCYGTGDTDLAAVLLDQLRTSGQTLAVAESCTGGLLGGRLTAIPGSSNVFVGGVTAYSNEVKTRALGVPAALIEEHGAVSEAVALAMVKGAQRAIGADAAIAVTGIAGPAGGTEEKPVGTVCLAAAVPGTRHAVIQRFPGGRDEVRRRSAQAALDLLRRLLVE